LLFKIHRLFKLIAFSKHKAITKRHPMRPSVLLQPVDQSAILTNPVHLRHSIGQYGGIGQSGACLTNFTISKLWFRQLDLVLIHLVVWAVFSSSGSPSPSGPLSPSLPASPLANFALMTGHEQIKPGAC
jgi:hypothetical protein